MPILKKNKTGKNKLTKGGHGKNPFTIKIPKESMEQLGTWELYENEPFSYNKFIEHLQFNVPTYDIIHKDKNSFEKPSKCVAQHANYKQTNYYRSHNFCEIDDIIAVVLGHLLEIPVYSMDKNMAVDSDGNNHAFFDKLSHIPLTFYDSSKTKFIQYNNGDFDYGDHFKHNAGFQKYITIKQIKNVYKNIQSIKKVEHVQVFTRILEHPIYQYDFFKKKIPQQQKKIPQQQTVAPIKTIIPQQQTVAPIKTTIPQQQTVAPKWVIKQKIPQQQIGGGKWEERQGVHMPVITIKALNMIIERNFNDLMKDNWIKNHKDYDAIIDGLNFMTGGAKKSITEELYYNLQKFVNDIFEGKNIKILLVYRGHITHSGTRHYIENDINRFIINAKNLNIRMDIMYVHTSVTDNKSPQGWIPNSPKAPTNKRKSNFKFDYNQKKTYKPPQLRYPPQNLSRQPQYPQQYPQQYPPQTYYSQYPPQTYYSQNLSRQRFPLPQQSPPHRNYGGEKTKKTKKTKKVRKHQGINQTGGNKGRLKKGYRYSGKKLKSGLPQIIKCKSKKC